MGQDAPDSGQQATPAAAGEDASGWVQGFTPLPTGTRVGELVVQSVLGAGEFGITYLTEHAKRNKRYALKEYFPRAIAYRDGPTVRARSAQATTFTWGLDRFMAEARAVQKLKHPAIVAIHGVTELGGSGYVGQAYEAGRDFGIWLHEHKRIAPQEELDKIMPPLLQGLDLAHSSNVFHLDLAPECIIIRDNGTPVLVDFGVFRVGLRRRLVAGAGADRPYSAPELTAPDGKSVGPWTDIYSLAGLLYLAVTGKPPVPARDRIAGTAMESASAAARGRFRSDFLAAIDAGLELAPGSRPQSVSAWRDQLLRTPASRLGVPKTTPPAQKPTTRVAAISVPMDGAIPPTTGATPAGGMSSKSQARSPLPPTEAESPPQELMENRGFRALFMGVAGLITGAIGGALASVVVASLLNPECGGDSCVAPFVLPLAILGAATGAWIGIRHAATPREPSAIDRRNSP